MQQFPTQRKRVPVRRIAGLIAAVSFGNLAQAQQAPPPEGIEVGRWILAPSFVSSVQHDDNVFRRDSSQPIDSDTLTNWVGGLRAMLPFRNSRFDLEYERTQRKYNSVQVDRDTEQIGAARLELNFGSRDRLAVSDRFTEGVATVLVDPGGEFLFQGQGYRLNRAEIELSREVPDHPGYTVRLTRTDFNFEPTEGPVGWFNYRGYDGSVEFRKPIARSKWFLVHADSRRFDHFEVNDDLDGDGDVDAVGVPFRAEKADALLFGLAGFTRPGQPFFIRVGYGKFRYDLVESEPYEGLVASALARLEVGSRTRIQGELARRPLPSSFPTYYIINEIKLGVERDVAREIIVGLDVLLGRNRYGSDVGISGCGGQIRKDRRRDVETSLDWEFHPRASLAVSASHIERGSNCDQSDYEANVGFVGLRFGWF